MKSSVILVIAFSVFFFASCAKTDDAESSEEVVISDGYNAAPNGEIAIDDQSFAGADGQNSGQRSAYQERARMLADNSRVTTMYDGYGNKTETRFFDNNPLVLSITVRTSAAGEKNVSVYAQNGTVNQLPENMFDRVLSAPANDLAAAAGIFEGRREPAIVQTSQPPLQPMPSYRFPVQTPPAQAVPVEPPTEPEIPEPAAAETAKPPTAPKQKTDKIDSNNPSDEPD